MTDKEILAVLSTRIDTLHANINLACERVNRDPQSVTIIAVSKTVSPRVAALAQQLGMKHFGESRPQELWRKAESMPAASFHMIGHLQRNKIERTLPLITLLHSGDSERLLEAISAFAVKQGTKYDVLLEVNLTGEANKGGFAVTEVAEVYPRLRQIPGIVIRGLMGMAAYTDDAETARPAFRTLRQLRDQLQQSQGDALPELSMGMSGDYTVAIEEGATMIRPGSTLFAGLEAA